MGGLGRGAGAPDARKEVLLRVSIEDTEVQSEKPGEMHSSLVAGRGAHGRLRDERGRSLHQGQCRDQGWGRGQGQGRDMGRGRCQGQGQGRDTGWGRGQEMGWGRSRGRDMGRGQCQGRDMGCWGQGYP